MDPLSIVSGVTGILTFIGAVLESLDKLNLFCEDVKNLPDDVHRLLDQIGHFASLIQTLLATDAERHASEDTAVQLALRYCRSADCHMRTIAQELTHSQVRNFSTVRTAWRRRVIKRSLQKLEQSKADLQAAYMIYEAVCRRYELQSGMQEQKRMMTQAVDEYLSDRASTVWQRRNIGFEDEQDAQDYRRRHHSYSRSTRARAGRHGSHEKYVGRRRYQISFTLPLWLCEGAWVISFERAIGSWSLNLANIDIIPPHHEAFRLCRRGYVADLKTMLENREVSVHSQDPDGNSLFAVGTTSWAYLTQADVEQVALQSFQPDMAAFLYEEGARPEAPQRRRYLDANGIYPGRPRYAKEAAIEAYTVRSLRCIEFASEKFEVEDLLLGPDDISATDCMSSPPSSWKHQHAIFRQKDAAIYMLNCMRSCLGTQRAIAALDRKFFSLRTVGSCSLSFLHLQSMLWHGGPIPGLIQCLELDKAALIQAIRVRANISVLDDLGRSPFTTMVEHAIAMGIGREWEGTRILEILVDAWTVLLASQNINLERYGAKEQRLYRSKYQASKGEWWREDGFVGFVTGPSPSDWHVWPRHFGDVYCAVFWDLIERPLRPPAMPCTYPEDAELCAYLIECDEYVLNAKPRRSGLKAKTLRWISSRACERSESVERRAAMYRARRVALDNAEAWMTGQLTDDEDDLHQYLLDEMVSARLTRPDRIGLRASLWSRPWF